MAPSLPTRGHRWPRRQVVLVRDGVWDKRYESGKRVQMLLTTVSPRADALSRTPAQPQHSDQYGAEVKINERPTDPGAIPDANRAFLSYRAMILECVPRWRAAHSVAALEWQARLDVDYWVARFGGYLDRRAARDPAHPGREPSNRSASR
jgi:hypothetical protein